MCCKGTEGVPGGWDKGPGLTGSKRAENVSALRCKHALWRKLIPEQGRNNLGQPLLIGPVLRRQLEEGRVEGGVDRGLGGAHGGWSEGSELGKIVPE